MVANYNLSSLHGHFLLQSLVMSRFEPLIGRIDPYTGVSISNLAFCTLSKSREEKKKW